MSLTVPLDPPRHLPESPPLSAQLKSRTSGRHAVLEGLVRLESPVSRDHYVEVLRRFSAFMGPWEDAVGALLPPHLEGWFQSRRRAHLLAMDLLALGCATSPRPPWPVPSYRSPDEVLGGLYVLEGSTLGGAVIVRRLTRDLALTPQAGAAYFNAHGPQAGVMWNAFRRLLDDDRVGWDHAHVIRGAQRTFDVLIDLFSAPGHAS